VHVTLRIVDGLPSLRTKSTFQQVKEALHAGADRFGFRLIHYSVQGDHLHLVAEAEDKHALRRGLVGLQSRLAHRINKIAGRKGRVFVDRYHLTVLRTPKQVKHAIAYVLNNVKKHAVQRGRKLARAWIDPMSTARGFFELGRGLQAARTWLLRVGWQRWGPVRPSSLPAGAG
jgi:REP element-mobilizing transposase RayT